MVNVLQVLVILFGYLGAYATKKRNILIFYVISTVFSILMFYSAGKIAAILPVLTTGIRYFVYIFKDKYKTKIPLYFCLLLHIIALIISTKAIETVFDIIPSALVIIGCFVYWYLDGGKLKLSIFILNLPWVVYYISSGLYLTTINIIIQNTLMAIAYYRIKRKNVLNQKCYN